MRAAGSSDGESVKGYCRTVPGGHSATSPASDGTSCATRAQSSGYCTVESRPPTPHARSGSGATTRRITAASAKPEGTRSRSRHTAAALATATIGITSATNFDESRSRPPPGIVLTISASALRPGPKDVIARTRTTTTASSASARTSGASTSSSRLRHNVIKPTPTTAIRQTVATAAHQNVRLAGTASAFQMPPRPSTVPSGPRAGSERNPKARTPAEPSVEVDAEVSSAATSHGSADNTHATSTPATRRARTCHDDCGTCDPPPSTQATATTRPKSEPLGVNPATASSAANTHQRRIDAVSQYCAAASAIHPSAPYPTRSPQWPWRSRSATKGFHSETIVAATAPVRPAPGTRCAASLPYPTPPTVSAANRIAVTRNPPSTTELPSATAQSCGTARGGRSPIPNVVSVTYDRGVDTASR